MPDQPRNIQSRIVRRIVTKARDRQAALGYLPSAHAVYVQCVHACATVPYPQRHDAARAAYDRVIEEIPAIAAGEDQVQGAGFAPTGKHEESVSRKEAERWKANALHQSRNMDDCQHPWHSVSTRLMIKNESINASAWVCNLCQRLLAAEEVIASRRRWLSDEIDQIEREAKRIGSGEEESGCKAQALHQPANMADCKHPWRHIVFHILRSGDGDRVTWYCHNCMQELTAEERTSSWCAAQEDQVKRKERDAWAEEERRKRDRLRNESETIKDTIVHLYQMGRNRV